MEVHAREAESGRNERARLLPVGPEGLSVLVELGVVAAGTPAAEHLLHRRDVDAQEIAERLQVRGQRDDGADVQVSGGPAVQAFPDARSEGIIDG